MAPSKTLKKRKGKREKNKKKEKPEAVLPPIPIDRKTEAAKNVREMFMEAEKIHKEYLNSFKSQKGRVKVTSSATVEKSKGIHGKDIEEEVSAVDYKGNNSKRVKKIKGSHNSSPTLTSHKKWKASKDTVEKNSSQIHQKNSEAATKEKTEFQLPDRGSSLQPAKKEGVIQKSDTGEYQQTTRPETNRKPEPKTIKKKSSRKLNKKQPDIPGKPDRYFVGSSSFVSLKILDQMKGDELETGNELPRKSALKKSSQQAKHVSNGSVPSKNDSIVTLPKTRKKKIIDRPNTISGDPKHTNTADGKRTNIPSEKRRIVESEFPPAREPERKVLIQSRRKHNPELASKTKNFPSNIDSTTSMAIATGELIGSNTSNSYFSSESDISKIDRKFMQILEAVTKSKIGYGDSKTPQITDPSKIESIMKEDEDDDGKFLPGSILKRINSLERKLEFLKPQVATSKEALAQFPKGPIKADVLPVLEELWVTENSFWENGLPAGTKPEVAPTEGVPPMPDPPAQKEGTPTETEKHQKSNGDTGAEREVKDSKPTQKANVPNQRKSPNTAPETPVSTPETKPPERVKKPKAKSHIKQSESKSTVSKTSRVSDMRKIEGDAEKKVENWSILKRLEKAFKTLGMDMVDLDNSKESASPAKKKLQIKKCEYSGKDRRIDKEESGKRTMNMDQTAVAKKKQKKAVVDDLQYGVDSNGSGDKNTDYKVVRPSKKFQDLVRSRDDTDRTAYQASVTHSFSCRPPVTDESKSDVISDEEMQEEIGTSKKKNWKSRLPLSDAHLDELNYKMDWDCERRKKRSTGQSKSYYDDLGLNHRKVRTSDHALSCSFTSLTEEDEYKQRKQTKLSSLLRRDEWDDDTIELTTSGKGDAAQYDLRPLAKNRKREKSMRGMMLNSSTFHDVLQLERENDELELKHLRQRHRQIVSEIKMSLNEIKRQQNLYCKLQRKTRKFKRDYNSKKKVLASYLEDVESNYERGQGVDKYPRSLSSDWGHHRFRRKSSVRDKRSEFDFRSRVKRDRSRSWRRGEAGELALSPVGTSSEANSVVLTHSYAEEATSETGDETAETEQNLESDKGEWRKGEEVKKQTSRESQQSYVPSYLTHLLQKLNRIILTERNHLESLVVKASASSNSTIYSEKARASSTMSTGHKQGKHLRKGSDDCNRSTGTSNKNAASSSFGVGSCRHQKVKQHSCKKTCRYHKYADADGNTRTVGKSIQCDPGGNSSFDSSDSEQEVVLSESFPDNPNSDTSLAHLERQMEECRYRKGDPSFRSKSHILKLFGEQSGRSRVSQEEEEAKRRKRELERILHINEKNLRKNNMFNRDSTSHAVDYDECHSKPRHPVYLHHRQQSIIIDHNREEENEESQIVLGHASRHSGVALGGRRRKSPKEYYLNSERNTESDYQRNRRHCNENPWKKNGKKSKVNGHTDVTGALSSTHRAVTDHVEEVPVNYWDLMGSTRGESRDAHCQTDLHLVDEDFNDINFFDETGSTNS